MHQAAPLICVLAAVFSPVEAQRPPTQDPNAIRVQGASTESQTPKTDFGSVISKGVAAASQERMDGFVATVASLDELIASPRPARLARSEVTVWNEQTAWLTSVRTRYQTLLRSYTAAATDVGQAESNSAAPFVPGGVVVSGAVSGVQVGGGTRSDLTSGGSSGDTSASGASITAAIAELNAQWLALQQAVQNESRRFQTLSNASKTRHDTAMNAIRNVK